MNNKHNEFEQAVKLRKKAEEIVLKKAVSSSEKLDALSPEEIRQTLHELQVHQIELEMQNEELRRVQANLDEAMERYFDLYNLAPVGYFTINEKGFIIEANLTFATLLGVEKNTLIKKPFTRFILPDDQDVFYNHHKQISKTVTDASQACELRMVKKDGTQFWVHLESTTALNGDGEQVYRVVMSDITERKKADEILSQSEEKFRKEFSTLFDDAPVGIALVDKNGIIQEVNNNLLRLLSIRKEEFIGSSFIELAPAFGLDITENITDFKNRLIEAPSKKEMTFLNKNNSKTTITVQSSTIKSGDEILGILYILNDITERKKAEEQLKNSEERYKNLIELAPDSIVTMNLKGYITSCNTAATRIFRYSKDDLVGRHFSKIGVLHVKEVPKYLKVFVSLLQGKSTGIYELAVYDKDGTSRIAETHIGLIKENNKISGICAITRDITERKRTEENLKNSLERLIFAQKAAKTGFWDWDMKTGKLTWSKEFFELFGLPSDAQPTFDTWRKVLHPNDRKRAEEKIYRSIEDKISLDNEYRIILSDGKERWIRAQGDTFYDYSGDPQRMGGICIDITRQKQMEEGLKQIERELNKAQQIAHVGSWVWDIKNQTLTWTDELYRIYGVDKDFTLTFDSIVSMIHPEDREKNAAKVKQLLESATTLEYEFRIIRPDTSIRHIFQSIEVSRDSTGEPLRAIGIIQDITERKKIEKEIIESEEKLKQILDSSPDAITVTDLKGNIIECNQTASEMNGSPKTELIGKNALEFISPKDRKKAQDNLMKILQAGSIKNEEYTLLTKDGQEYPAELSTSLIRDASGNPQSFVSIVRDITERKKAEGEIKILARFPSENPYPVLRIKKDGEVIYSNKAGFEVLDFWKTSIGQEVPDRWRNIIRKKFTSKNLKEEEEEINDKIFSFVVSPVTDEGYVNVYGRDITERKKAEGALIESQEKYRLITENTNDLIIITNTDKTFRYVSPSIKSLGYTPDELIGQDSFILLHPEDNISITSMLKQLIIGRYKPGTSSRFEYRLRDKSGVYHLFETAVKFVKDESGKHVLLSISRDITERKKAAEELQKSETLLNDVSDMAHVGGWVLDIKTKDVYWTKETYRIHDISIDEKFDLSKAVIFFDLPDRSKLEVALQHCIEIGEPFDLVLPFTSAKGRHLWTRAIGRAEKNDSGKVVKLIGTFQDITERKNAEEEIKKERDFSKSIVDTAQTIVMVLDTVGNIVSFNPYMEELSGYKIDEVKGKDWFTTFLPECDYDQIKHIFKKSLRGIHTRGNINPIIAKDGCEILIEWYDKTLKEKDGKVIGLLAIGQDITERKKAEEALRESQKRFQALTETTNDFVWETDANGVYTYCSPQMNDLWGYKPEDMIGRTPFDVMIPEDRARVIKMFRSMSKSPKSFQGLESDSWDKSGRIVKLETSGVPFFENDGRLRGYRGISRDITERKRAEENLRKNEEKFRILFDSSPDLIIETDDDGIILALNQMMAKSLGSPVEKLIGKNIFDILPKEVAEERAKIARMALKDGENQETDDERAGRYFHNIYVPVLHPDGTKTIQTIVRDITEKKKTEDALLESEEKYRILFNDVPVGIGITDKNGHAMDCNQYLAEMFRMTCGEFKGNNVKSLYLNPKDRQRFQNILNKEGRVVDWECLFKRKDGSVFSAILNADVIERDGEKLNLTTLRDITERKVAEEKIRKQNVQLKKLDGVKTDFLNTTSHELRTPVASIKGYIQMLLKHTLGDITEEQKKALEVVLRNTNRLDALIQDILDISRLESGTMRFIPEKTDIIKMINEVAETMQTSADVKNIKINSDLQKDLPDLMIDSERVKQVLINLVDNAIKFSPDGSMILIKARKEKEDIVFEVQDFGRGIPKNKQNKIFERFYQVDSGTDRKFGGIGLGLTISKKIIDTYGGHIWVDSIVGKGSSFKFSLPLQSTKDIEDDLQEIPMELP